MNTDLSPVKSGPYYFRDGPSYVEGPISPSTNQNKRVLLGDDNRHVKPREEDGSYFPSDRTTGHKLERTLIY
jgi:hypothetical protein